MSPTTTLPLPPALSLLIGVALATLLLYGALSLMGRKRTAPIWEDWTPGWAAILVLLGLVWIALFSLTIMAAMAGTWGLIADGNSASLGLGGLIAALLGAPFLIWGTVLKTQTVRYQKEGHMTDRIAKAVEMLGAEKKVDRIGRVLHVFRGESMTVSVRGDETPPSASLRLTPATLRNDFALEPFDSPMIDYKVWEREERVIDWKDEPFKPNMADHLVSEGDWQVFSETTPNLEVRIGAILALERIAQDSTTHDKGRDHVRVMEILCAYIRNNYPAKGANSNDPRKPFYQALAALRNARNPGERYNLIQEIETAYAQSGLVGDKRSNLRSWGHEIPAMRSDIQAAINVLGNRSEAQRIVEFGPSRIEIINRKQMEDDLIARLRQARFPTWSDQHEFAKSTFDAYGEPKYRLDLRNVNLQRADLSNCDFSWARLSGSRLDFCDIKNSDFTHAQMNDCSFNTSDLSGSNFSFSTMTSSALVDCTAFEANFILSGFQFTWFHGGVYSFSDFTSAFCSAAKITSINLAKVSFRNVYAANLIIAGCHGPDTVFSGLKFDEFSQFSENRFSKPCFHNTDFSKFPISADQINLGFGDASVILPERLRPPPAHWLTWTPEYSSPDESKVTLLSEWHRWRDTPEGEVFIPAPPPTP